MSVKLYLIRKTKALFIRMKMHRLVEPFSGVLLNLAYLSKVSKWVQKNGSVEFNDFYSSKWDYSKRFKLYEYIIGKKNLSGEIVYIEFGVAGGHSFTWWVHHNSHPSSRFIGFDTFEGLPEDWGVFRKGDMSADSQVPQLDDNRVSFGKGLFQETVPAFLEGLDKTRHKVILMDADLYTSTLYALTSLGPYLHKGDIIMFDEFNVPRHEFLAFTNFIESYYIKPELIGAANNYYFCAFEVK
jgi:O-methyltransferase